MWFLRALQKKKKTIQCENYSEQCSLKNQFCILLPVFRFKTILYEYSTPNLFFQYGVFFSKSYTIYFKYLILKIKWNSDSIPNHSGQETSPNSSFIRRHLFETRYAIHTAPLGRVGLFGGDARSNLRFSRGIRLLCVTWNHFSYFYVLSV